MRTVKLLSLICLEPIALRPVSSFGCICCAEMCENLPSELQMQCEANTRIPHQVIATKNALPLICFVFNSKGVFIDLLNGLFDQELWFIDKKI